jgi:hypothetical protein
LKSRGLKSYNLMEILNQPDEMIVKILYHATPMARLTFSRTSRRARALMPAFEADIRAQMENSPLAQTFAAVIARQGYIYGVLLDLIYGTRLSSETVCVVCDSAVNIVDAEHRALFEGLGHKYHGVFDNRGVKCVRVNSVTVFTGRDMAILSVRTTLPIGDYDGDKHSHCVGCKYTSHWDTANNGKFVHLQLHSTCTRERDLRFCPKITFGLRRFCTYGARLGAAHPAI